MELKYCSMNRISDDDCRSLIGWLAGRNQFSDVSELLSCCGSRLQGKQLWVLAHCDDGVTWGRVSDDTLLLSCTQVERWSTPEISESNLQQVRVFGDEAELLIWLVDRESGRFRGRVLKDDLSYGQDDPFRPKDETYLIAATGVAPDGAATAQGFTVVSDAGGRTQVLPLELSPEDFGANKFPVGLSVRHYFNQDSESGSARIAGSRLLSLRRIAEGEQVTEI